jgi:hypothetical protein|tara:strand:+ start:262 stop:504 length:243 start_codon:yes stop_codon:yes gene_type:complete
MKKEEILKVIGQLQYEISILDIDEERLTGVDIRTEELKNLVNNVVLDAVIKCEKCGSIEMYQHTKTKDKCEDCGHIQSFL